MALIRALGAARAEASDMPDTRHSLSPRRTSAHPWTASRNSSLKHYLPLGNNHLALVGLDRLGRAISPALVLQNVRKQYGEMVPEIRTVAERSWFLLL